MGASGSLIEPPSQPVVKIVEAIYKANCNIKMNSIMIPPPPGVGGWDIALKGRG